MKQSYLFVGIMVLFSTVWTQVSTGETPYGISHGLNRSTIPLDLYIECGKPGLSNKYPYPTRIRFFDYSMVFISAYWVKHVD